MMDLTPAESTMIGFLRGVTGSDFVINVVARDSGWFVTMASPNDPVLVGGGLTFDAALMAAVASGSDNPGDGETVPAARALRVVAGSDHHPERKVA
jgi:hypothetical protein